MRHLVLIDCVLERLPNTAETFFDVLNQGVSLSKIKYRSIKNK